MSLGGTSGFERLEGLSVKGRALRPHVCGTGLDSVGLGLGLKGSLLLLVLEQNPPDVRVLISADFLGPTRLCVRLGLELITDRRAPRAFPWDADVGRSVALHPAHGGGGPGLNSRSQDWAGLKSRPEFSC